MAQQELVQSNDMQTELSGWHGKLAKFVNSNGFNNFIVGAIIAAGIVVGCETYTEFAHRNQAILDVIEAVILGIFVVEIVLKVLAEGNKPWRYFYNPWNVFDFIVVAASLLPFGAQYLAVLRLARILRVFRLVTTMPKLQIIVSALLRSIPAMGYVTVLLFLLFYIYAVIAVFTYGQNDPVHFGSLPISVVSLFRAVTLEDWTDLMYINMYGCANYGYDGMMDQCTNSSASPVGAALFFISFILAGALIVLNFFIGVVLASMDEVSSEEEAKQAMIRRTKGQLTLHEELLQLSTRLQELNSDVSVVASIVKDLPDQEKITMPDTKD